MRPAMTSLMLAELAELAELPGSRDPSLEGSLGALPLLGALLVVGVALTLVGLVHGAAVRADHSSADARALALRVAAGIATWLALLAALARSGVLADFEARPPRMFFVLGGALALFAYATTRPGVARLLAASPRSWLVGLQSMRVPIELGLFGLYAAGRLPKHLTLEGRNFDLLVGLSAPLVALAVSRGLLGRRGLLAWHAASLALLANVVGMAITTMPGPLHLAWPGVSNTIIAEWPFVWLPGFLVPVALFGHVLSLRQLPGASPPT